MEQAIDRPHIGDDFGPRATGGAFFGNFALWIPSPSGKVPWSIRVAIEQDIGQGAQFFCSLDGGKLTQVPAGIRTMEVTVAQCYVMGTGMNGDDKVFLEWE